MLDPGTVVLVLFAEGADQELLHRGVVVGSKDDTFVARFTERIHPVVGSGVRVYHYVDQRFMGASATVQALLGPRPGLIIRFLVVDEFEASENRGSFRVSVVGAELVVGIDKASQCALVDVSADGLGIIAPVALEVGALVRATLSYEGEQFCGRACVRFVRERDDGRYQCGLQAMEREHNLRKGLQHINIQFQREQLHRTRGRQWEVRNRTGTVREWDRLGYAERRFVLTVD